MSESELPENHREKFIEIFDEFSDVLVGDSFSWRFLDVEPQKIYFKQPFQSYAGPFVYLDKTRQTVLDAKLQSQLGHDYIETVELSEIAHKDHAINPVLLTSQNSSVKMEKSLGQEKIKDPFELLQDSRMLVDSRKSNAQEVPHLRHDWLVHSASQLMERIRGYTVVINLDIQKCYRGIKLDYDSSLKYLFTSPSSILYSGKIFRLDKI